MKINDVKHNHSLTDLLKVLIFSILMITPLLSVATRCLYVICNKNAYQSAEITQTTYDKQEVTNVKRLRFNNGDENIYQTGTNEVLITGYVKGYEIYNTTGSIDEFSDGLIFNQNSPLYFEFDLNTSNEYYMYLYYFGTTYGEYHYFSITFETGQIDYNTYIDFIEDSNTTNEYANLIEDHFIIDSPNTYYDYNEVESTTLDNVFEYSVNKLAQSPILSWTQQTAVYTGVNAMTSQLGVNMPTIPMLITYWFLLTIIYVILDIVLKLFTTLTHMIGGKKSSN